MDIFCARKVHLTLACSVIDQHRLGRAEGERKQKKRERKRVTCLPAPVRKINEEKIEGRAGQSMKDGGASDPNDVPQSVRTAERTEETGEKYK